MVRMDEPTLSQFGRASTVAAPAARMMGAFAGDFRDDIDINLGVGYVNERAIPRDLIAQAMQRVLDQPQRYRAALNYGGPEGSPNLIRSLRQFLTRHRIGGLTDDVLDQRRIIIGPSGATSLLDAFAQVLPTGIVVTTDPVYYIFADLLERRGHELLAVPEDEQGIRTDLLRRKLDELGERREHITFFYIVTVSNPTCTILSDARRRELVDIAVDLSRRLGRKVPIVFDTAYELLIHDPDVTPPQSALLHDEHGLAYEIGTMSKILAPAMRVGYVIGRDGPMMDAIVQRTSDIGFSAPLINQEIASCLLDDDITEQIDRTHRSYRDKAQQVRRWMTELLGDHLAACTGGSAGFYFYLTLHDVQTHEQSAFFRYLTRTTGDAAIDGPPDNRGPRVIYVPGEFCVHRRGDLVDVAQRQLRLSYGFEELERIGEALELMRLAADYGREAEVRNKVPQEEVS